ncbi:hypothetical protein BOTCAL_0212g00020 [Botryotinia calthae]|uniref:Uncharacterized protein n=1 Tax=Botryotinia calthae TaxID=38488 RepID=A0A4Y8D0U3_9HELO|nr:hypothetical protein BOTCAL_0212g00020 [Botryotinia calthae]
MIKSRIENTIDLIRGCQAYSTALGLGTRSPVNPNKIRQNQVSIFSAGRVAMLYPSFAILISVCNMTTSVMELLCERQLVRGRSERARKPEAASHGIVTDEYADNNLTIGINLIFGNSFITAP